MNDQIDQDVSNYTSTKLHQFYPNHLDYQSPKIFHVDEPNQWIIPFFIRNKDGEWTDLKAEWNKLVLRIKDEAQLVQECKTEFEQYDAFKTKTVEFTTAYCLYRKEHFIVDYISKNRSYTKKEMDLQIKLQMVELPVFASDQNINQLQEYLYTQQKMSIDKEILLLKRIDNTKFDKPSLPICVKITQLDEEIPYVKQLPEHDLWYYFNQIELPPSLPFVYYKGFYKFRQDTKLQKEWMESDEDALIFYVKHEETNSYQKFYMNPSAFIAQIKLPSDKTPQDILNIIMRVFSLQNVVSNPNNQKSIKAVCNVAVEKPIGNLKLLLLYIHSSPKYNEVLFAEESRVVMTDRQFLFLTYYNNARRARQYISFNIRDVLKEDETSMLCVPPKDPKKPYFIQLTIRHCSSQDQLNSEDETSLIKMISELMYDYHKDVPYIITDLQFNKIKIPEMVKVVREKKRPSTAANVLPGLRTRGYPNYPRMVDVDDIEPIENTFYHANLEAESKEAQDRLSGQNLMKDSHNNYRIQGMIFPKSGPDQKYFICDREEDYKYIDLKEPPSTSIIQGQEGRYTLVPNCFKTNKVENENSKLDDYMKDKSKEKVDKEQGFVIQTGKGLTKDQYGSATAWVNRWYTLIKPERVLFRRGLTNDMNRSVLYALQMVSKGTNKIPTMEEIDVLHRKMMVNLTLYDIMSESISVDATITLEQRMEQFKTGYIDPFVYYTFLCRYFNVEIVLFKKDITQDDFYLSHPPFTFLYTTNQVRPTVVCLSVNQGGEAQQAKSPFVELMVSVPFLQSIEKKKKIKDIPQENTMNDLSPYIESCLKEMYGKKVRPVLFKGEVIVSQTLDRYGLATWVHLTKKGRAISVRLQEPIHAINVPITDKIECWTESEVKELGLVTKPVHMDIYSGYNVEKDGYVYFIPVQRSDDTNLTIQYEQYEKLARYLKEYVCYLFSKYLKRANELILEDKALDNQVKLAEEIEKMDGSPKNKSRVNDLQQKRSPLIGVEKLTIYALIRNFVDESLDIIGSSVSEDEYLSHVNDISRVLSKPNWYYDGDHLKITSMDVQKKLVYLLLLEYQTKRENLESYQSSLVMRNFYETTRDFDIRPITQLVKNNTSYNTYIDHQFDTIKQGSTVILLSATMYILYYTFPEYGQVTQWIMQPVSSYEQALFLTQEWYTYRSNGMIWWQDALLLANNDAKRVNVLPIKPEECNQWIWKSPTQYDYSPSSKQDQPIPCLSVIRNKGNTFLQVMFPF